MAVIIPPTPITAFPGPLPNVVDPAFRQQALQWVNHLTNVKISEFNALLSNVNNNAQAAVEVAALAEEKAADAAASAVDAAAGAEAAAGATAAAGLASASAVSAGVSANTAAAAAADAQDAAAAAAQSAEDAAAIVVGDLINDGSPSPTRAWSSQKVSTELGGKEPSIAAGTGAQYWSGSKAWTDFATSVRATTLTGLSVATAIPVVAADSVLSAVGKLQAQVNLAGGGEGDVSGPGASVTAGALAVWSGTSGQYIAQSGLSGLLKATGGVPAAAVAGTDYAAATATLSDAAAASTLPATSATGLAALLQTTRNVLKWLVDKARYVGHAYPGSGTAIHAQESGQILFVESSHTVNNAAPNRCWYVLVRASASPATVTISSGACTLLPTGQSVTTITLPQYATFTLYKIEDGAWMGWGAGYTAS